MRRPLVPALLLALAAGGWCGAEARAAVTVVAVDAQGRVVDPATSHASLSRTVPEELMPPGEAPLPDDDALRFVVMGEAAELPAYADLVSLGSTGVELDRLTGLALTATACPSSAACRASLLVRAVAERADRQHPRVSGRSLVAAVGGRLELRIPASSGAAPTASGWWVGGPRHTALGPIERLRARVRVRILRVAVGGGPALGGDDSGAVAWLRQELGVANALWGQCGISLGEPAAADVLVVDPPPPFILTVGCGLGLPASGGVIALRAGAERVAVQLHAGESPSRVARRVARALERAGLKVQITTNAPSDLAVAPSFDLAVRDASGAPVALARDGEAPLSSDGTLAVCLAEAALGDGLTHFTDFDSRTGTPEERALLRAFDDGDPGTLDLVIVPHFASTGRIGESFLGGGAAPRNAIVMDRAGIAAGARAFTLAHELGHLLLEQPGHPDDYGVDTPTALMDADAADGSILGPRRLPLADCERALRQVGPGSPLPLLTPWPLREGAAAGADSGPGAGRAGGRVAAGASRLATGAPWAASGGSRSASSSALPRGARSGRGARSAPPSRP